MKTVISLSVATVKFKDVPHGQAFATVDGSRYIKVNNHDSFNSLNLEKNRLTGAIATVKEKTLVEPLPGLKITGV